MEHWGWGPTAGPFDAMVAAHRWRLKELEYTGIPQELRADREFRLEELRRALREALRWRGKRATRSPRRPAGTPARRWRAGYRTFLW